jgi:hypothetical protein
MTRKNSEPAKPRPVGRPKTRPAGTRFRGIWLTDAEYEAVKELVKQRRAEAKR